MTRITDTLHGFASIAVVLAVGIAGLAVPRSCNQQDLVADQERRLDQVMHERDAALARSIHVLDSAVEADAVRDQAWLAYVRSFRDSSDQAMQRSAQAAAARARRVVEQHGGELPKAPDTGSGRPPCLVTLTCSEAAAWQASDSLMRAAAESTASWTPVAATACSTKVLEARVTCESACADRSRNVAAGLRFRSAFIALVSVGVLGVVFGWMAGQ